MNEDKKTVLIVDDNKSWREFLVEILQTDFNIVSCADYKSALEQIVARKHPFHVVLTDMRLVDEEAGNEDGLRLIKSLNQGKNKTKTIVLTGYATVHTVIDAFTNLSVYRYLEKVPSNDRKFDPQELIEIIHNAAKESEKKSKRNLSLQDTQENGSTKIKVFISYAKEDIELVEKLYFKLKKYSWIDPWMDTKILVGKNWEHEIEKELNNANVVLICISNRSMNKTGYVQSEIRKAQKLQENIPSDDIFMIPVLLEKTDIPHDLQKYQWADISKPDEIKSIIKSLKQKYEKMSLTHPRP